MKLLLIPVILFTLFAAPLVKAETLNECIQDQIEMAEENADTCMNEAECKAILNEYLEMCRKEHSVKTIAKTETKENV